MKRNSHELDPRAVRFCLGELDDKLAKTERYKAHQAKRYAAQKIPESSWRDFVDRVKKFYRSLVGRDGE